MSTDTQAGSGRIDTVSRVILASPRTLFRAFLDPEMLASWRAPDGMTARIERFEPGIGGGYRIALSYAAGQADPQGKTSPGQDVAEVKFIDLAPDTRIVEEVRFLSDDPAYAHPMTLITSFDTVVDGTKVSIAAHDVPAAIGAKYHKTGIASSLRNLARLTE